MKIKIIHRKKNARRTKLPIFIIRLGDGKLFVAFVIVLVHKERLCLIYFPQRPK